MDGPSRRGSNLAMSLRRVLLEALRRGALAALTPPPPEAPTPAPLARVLELEDRVRELERPTCNHATSLTLYPPSAAMAQAQDLLAGRTRELPEGAAYRPTWAVRVCAECSAVHFLELE